MVSACQWQVSGGKMSLKSILEKSRKEFKAKENRIDAAKSYDNAHKRYHGTFAHLNFSLGGALSVIQ